MSFQKISKKSVARKKSVPAKKASLQTRCCGNAIVFKGVKMHLVVLRQLTPHLIRTVSTKPLNSAEQVPYVEVREDFPIGIFRSKVCTRTSDLLSSDVSNILTVESVIYEGYLFDVS